MSRGSRLFLGMIVSNVVGLALCAIVYWVSRKSSAIEQVVTVPSLVLIPILIGVIAMWFWRPLNLTKRQIAGHTFLATLIGIAGSVIVFQEGTICLIILSPILYGGLLAGALGAGTWIKRSDRLHIYVMPLIGLAIIVEPSWRQPHTSVVTDEIQIAAPPSKVWPHVLAFKTIPDPPAYWLFHIGLPYPMETTNTGDYVGADRTCVFSGGAVFKEKVVEFEPESLLTFEIIEQPPDPELIGHLDARRGQFELRANADGTTTLIGRTWYTLHVSPAWYFDWWTHDIFRAVHLRVMNNVKKLAEKGP